MIKKKIIIYLYIYTTHIFHKCAFRIIYIWVLNKMVVWDGLGYDLTLMTLSSWTELIAIVGILYLS